MRLDAGYESGDTVSQYYDNLVAKLIVWGADRESARHRMLRALGETQIAGVATTIPADVVILSHPDFIAARHSTRWVEDRLDLSVLPPSPVDPGSSGASGASSTSGADDGAPRVLREVTAEVDGRRYEVRLWVPDITSAGGARQRGAAPQAESGGGRDRARARSPSPCRAPSSRSWWRRATQVEVGETVCLLEAMKMENAINAEKAGTVKEVRVAAGDSVGPGDVIAIIE